MDCNSGRRAAYLGAEQAVAHATSVLSATFSAGRSSTSVPYAWQGSFEPKSRRTLSDDENAGADA
jgi:hypothetical protein